MKTSISLLFVIISSITLTAAQTENVNVIVEVRGISNKNGNIEIGLYNNEDTFPIYNKEFRGVSIAASSDSIRHVFNNVPKGTYAIAVWHDKNTNQKLDNNFFGIPIEDYGFSYNKYGTFGAPNFKDVSFHTKGKSMTFIINIK